MNDNPLEDVDEENVDHLVPESSTPSGAMDFSVEVQRKQFLGGISAEPKAQRQESINNITEVHPAKVETLTPYNEEFFVEEIKEGEDVLVGGGLGDGKYWLRCDWSAFGTELDNLSPQRLNDFFDRVGGLQEQAPQLGAETRKMLHACWRAAQKAQQVLGKPGLEFIRNESFSQYSNHQKPADCIKPLSASRGEAVCTEFALITHHVLDRLGIKSSVVIGAYKPNQAELPGRHTFLVLDSGKVVFDPTTTATQADCWPPKVFKAERPLTVNSLKDMSTEGEFGHKIKCSDILTG